MTYLEIAKSGATHLADTWENLAANPTVVPTLIRSPWTQGFAQAAFALAEIWKATGDPVDRDAGLSIIRYITEMKSVDG